MPTSREKQIAKLNDVLGKWRGAHAQLWSYTASLTTLEIRLFREGQSSNLYLHCSPCLSIAAPVVWTKVDLVVDFTDPDLFVVRDAEASVSVLCRQISVSEGGEPFAATGTQRATVSDASANAGPPASSPAATPAHL